METIKSLQFDKVALEIKISKMLIYISTESMGKHGNLWENVGIASIVAPTEPSDLWENVGIYGKTWEFMGKHGNFENVEEDML